MERDERRVVAARQVGAADRSGEERVADEQVLDAGSPALPTETDTAGTMSRRVMRARLAAAERDDLSRRVEHVDRRLRLHVQAEHHARLDGALVEKQVVAVQIHRDAERPLGGADAGHVIDVSVGEQDVADRQRLPLGEGEQAGTSSPGSMSTASRVSLAADHEAVLEEGPDGLRLDYDHMVILAVLDDLMFTSKIKIAASQLGVPVAFARIRRGALAEMRKSAPSLVILDLNNPRTDPLGTVAAMKADPALAAIPTVGFVSHVDTVTIDAARQAGVGEVLARSAFTQRLPEILRETRSLATTSQAATGGRRSPRAPRRHDPRHSGVVARPSTASAASAVPLPHVEHGCHGSEFRRKRGCRSVPYEAPGERPRHDRVDLLRDGRVDRARRPRFSLHGPRRSRRRNHRAEGQPAGQHLEQNHAQREDVGGAVDRPAECLLG